MDRLSELELLVKIAESGHIGRAAEALDLSRPAASRMLAALEKRLGTRLVERNTRRVFITDAGQTFVERARHILHELQDAELSLTRKTLDPSGTLRVGSSLSFAMHQIAPRLRKFRTLYPRLDVLLETQNRYGSGPDDHLDIAIRTREFEPDSSLTIRRLATTNRVLCASPAYVAQRGTPKTPDDLLTHDFLVYTHANRAHELWLSQHGYHETVKLRAVLESNEGQVLRAAALDGLGILVQPSYIVYNDLVSGRLLPLLTDWQLPQLHINMAYRTREHLPAKTRAFIEFMVAEFAANNYERRWTSNMGLKKIDPGR